MVLTGRAAFPAVRVLLVVVLAITVSQAPATTPAGGTVSTITPTLTFTSGPHTISNPGNFVTGNVTCSPPGRPCDHFELGVDLPADFAATNPEDVIRIEASWPNANEDFDFYLLLASDDSVVSTDGATGNNPEVIEIPAGSGQQAYRIRVVPFAAAGGTATVTVSLVTAVDSDGDGVSDRNDACAGTPPGTMVASNGCPPPPGLPRFFSHVAPTGVASATNEPSIGCNWTTEQTFSNTNPDGGTNELPNGGTALYFGGFASYMYKITFNDCSSPAQATWDEKPLLSADTPRAAGDPILFTDKDTGRTWTVQLEGLTPAGATIDITDDDGETFIPTDGVAGSDIDHQTLGTGPYPADFPADLHPLYPNAVYYGSQSVVEARTVRSDNGGLVFNTATPPMYTGAECRGLHGHVKVAPNDGTVYVPAKNCGGSPFPALLSGGKAAVVVSEDAGVTWAVRQVPNAFTPSEWDSSIGVATDGTIYLGYQSLDGHPRIAVSHDKGVTWSTSVDVGRFVVNDGPVLNTAFPAVVAGDPDRAAFIFYGSTTGDGPGQDHTGTSDNEYSAFSGVWDIYVATTFDGGASWATTNITKGDPVQRGPICGGGGCRNLLDFIDATIDKEGRILIAGEDGCTTPACIQNVNYAGPGSQDAKGFIPRQIGGKRMFAAFDPPLSNRPGAPALTGSLDATQTVATLSWSVPDDGGSPITGYKVYRKREGEAGFTLLATVVGTTYSDATFDNTVPNAYHVTAINALGEGPYCLDFTPTLVDLGNVCELPGVTKLTDSDGTGGTAPPGSAGPGMDLRTLQLAQRFAVDGNIKLAFRLNTDAGQVPQPTGSAWFVSFKLPDGSYKGVRMEWQPASPNQPTFLVYVPGANNSGGVDGRFVDSSVPADPESSYDAANGHVTIVAKLSDLGLQPGDVIAGFNAGVTQTTDPGGIGPGATATIDEMPDGLAYAGDHAVNDNAFCAPNARPVARLIADLTSGMAPLTVTFDASLSSDPNAGDRITTYAFDFGVTPDSGDAARLEQAAPKATYTYTTPGTYTARLTVRDSQGLNSTDATVVISVTAPATNQLPLANAGLAFSINEGESTLLNGSASSDPDGDRLDYAWSQIAGPSVTLVNPGTATPSLVAPSVSEDTALTFRLTVSDPSAGSSTDDVTVTVRDLAPDAPEARVENNRVLGGSMPLPGLLALGLLGLLPRRKKDR